MTSGGEAPVGHSHERAKGRTVDALGLCEVEDVCRAQGHAVLRSNLERSGADATVVREVCLTCTEVAGRLEGLRLWQSVCPCCFSSAFPEGLPSLGSLHSRTSKGTATAPPSR